MSRDYALAMTLHKSIASAVQSARQVLTMTEVGYGDFLEGGERRYAGLVSAITLGRSISNIIQNIRGFDAEFGNWWAVVCQEAFDNEESGWFVKLRNRIEKQGILGASGAAVEIDSMNGNDIAELYGRAPYGTTSIFLGDSLGRSGWTVTLPDGTETVVYFKIPTNVGSTSLLIEDAPGGLSIEEIFPLWLGHLRTLVAQTETRYPV